MTFSCSVPLNANVHNSVYSGPMGFGKKRKMFVVTQRSDCAGRRACGSSLKPSIARRPCRVWHHGLVLLLSDLFLHQSTRGRLSLSLSLSLTHTHTHAHTYTEERLTINPAQPSSSKFVDFRRASCLYERHLEISVVSQTFPRNSPFCLFLFQNAKHTFAG